MCIRDSADSDEYQKNPAVDEEVKLTVPYPQGKSLSELSLIHIFGWHNGLFLEDQCFLHQKGHNL